MNLIKSLSNLINVCLAEEQDIVREGHFCLPNPKTQQLLQISLKVLTRDYLYNVRKAVKLFEWLSSNAI